MDYIIQQIGLYCSIVDIYSLIVICIPGMVNKWVLTIIQTLNNNKKFIGVIENKF